MTWTLRCGDGSSGKTLSSTGSRNCRGMRVGRVEVAVEQSPVEVVHSRSGGRVPDQDRGHLRCHITWDMTCGASSYVLVAGDWSAVFRSRHSADLGDQPVDQKHGGVVGVMGGMAPDEVMFGSRQVEVRWERKRCRRVRVQPAIDRAAPASGKALGTTVFRRPERPR